MPEYDIAPGKKKRSFYIFSLLTQIEAAERPNTNFPFPKAEKYIMLPAPRPRQGKTQGWRGGRMAM